jgi:sporulation protein YlmC with PRC-barrel domain
LPRFFDNIVVEMEIFYSKLVGMPVYETDGLRPILLVQDVIIDPENGKLLAFVVDERRGIIICPTDIVTVRNGIVIRSEEDLGRYDDVLRVKTVVENVGSLFKKPVVTENGKVLGKVVDFALDDKFLVLKSLHTAKVFFGIVQYDTRIIPAGNIVEVTAAKVVVKDDEAVERVVAEEKTAAVVDG